MPRPAHFEIHADDPQRAKAFYETVFGWLFTAWGDAYWLISTGTDEAGIDGGLVPRRGARPAADAPVTGFVLTVNVADLDATTRVAEVAGGRVVVERAAVPGVGWLAYCKDTEENVFGVMQPDEGAA